MDYLSIHYSIYYYSPCWVINKYLPIIYLSILGMAQNY